MYPMIWSNLAKICPCSKDCPERTAECKKTCKRWKVYEEAKKVEYAQRKERCEQKDALVCMVKNRKKKGLYI